MGKTLGQNRQPKILCALVSLGFLACAPQVTLDISHPRAPQDIPQCPVTFFSGSVPSNFDFFKNEVGYVKISDRGLSIHCDSATIHDQVQQIACQNGATFALILDETTPNSGNTCHEIEVKLYALDEAEKQLFRKQVRGASAPQNASSKNHKTLGELLIFDLFLLLTLFFLRS
ncbi:MAG TPA: hypothetical protein VLM37_12290 [Fibrobacteraceae bacterium]|nr:hypothetical protein [Fibrobacteraceae bacterium]